jgi:putative transposase
VSRDLRTETSPKGAAVGRELRQRLGPIFRELARYALRECQIIEGHLQFDHVLLVIAILPKNAVAAVIGFL